MNTQDGAENGTRDKVETKNMVLIISTTGLVIFLGIIISWLTGTGPQRLKCDNSESFFDGKCYKNQIECVIDNGSGVKYREGNTYSSCQAMSCMTGFELVEGVCMSDVRTRMLSIEGPMTAKSYTVGAYPKIKINSAIKGGSIKITIDFQESYKDGRYDNYIFGGKADGSPANPAPFGLFFFLGKGNQGSLSPYSFGYGGFFNAIANRNGGDLRNSNSLGINGVIPGNQIINGYTREIPIQNSIVFATKSDEWTQDYKYKRLNILDYINNNIGSEIFVGGFLSSMGSIDGRKFTEIKGIQIEYIGEEDAIVFIK